MVGFANSRYLAPHKEVLSKFQGLIKKKWKFCQ
jgi:hypothetical protein